MILIEIDKEKVYSVLSNFITNAIKFTPEHCEIKIQSYLQNNEIITHVVDNGIGIEEQNHKLIFEPFTKARTKGLKREKGSWLGLSICIKIVEFHNGSIGVESSPSKGSDFWFALPLEN